LTDQTFKSKGVPPFRLDERPTLKIAPKREGPAVPLEIPTPDGVLELFRDEIVVREAEIDREYGAIVKARSGVAWDRPYPGVETLATPGGPMLMRVSFRRLINVGASNEAVRIRHDLRQLRNDIRAAIPSESQVVFIPPRMTHVDHPDGIEIICYTHGIVRAS